MKTLETIVKENSDLSEKALTPAQRMAKSRVFKRLAPKMKIARQRAARKKADPEKLKNRARKKARKFFQDRILKQSGKNFADLSPAEKSRIEKMLDKKKAAIEKLAKKLLPKVKKAENERISNKSSEAIND